VGALFAGDERRVVLDLVVPASAVGAMFDVGFRGSWHAVATQQDVRVGDGHLAVRVVGTAQEAVASRDMSVFAESQSAVLALRQRDAVEAWRSGDVPPSAVHRRGQHRRAAGSATRCSLGGAGARAASQHVRRRKLSVRRDVRGERVGSRLRALVERSPPRRGDALGRVLIALAEGAPTMRPIATISILGFALATLPHAASLDALSGGALTLALGVLAALLASGRGALSVALGALAALAYTYLAPKAPELAAAIFVAGAHGARSLRGRTLALRGAHTLASLAAGSIAGLVLSPLRRR
jgi:hypothetical protein